MERIEMLDPEVVDGETARLFEAAVQMLGRVPNSYRVLGRVPLVAKLLLPFNAVLQRQGAGSLLSTRLKEMVVVKTSQLNGCRYWVAHNTSLGQAAGITQAQIEAIGSDDYMDSDVLSAREKAAVLWAEHVTRNTARSRDDVFEQVSAEFSPEEVIELTLMSAYFNFFNRITDSLGVPLEIPEEVDLIKGSVTLDPEKVRRYLEALVREWPAEIPGPNPD